MKTASLLFREAIEAVPTVPKHEERNAILKRFWKKVRKGDGGDSCWEWIGGKIGDGYGNFAFRQNGEKKSVLAHRFVFEQHHDMIVWPGFCVLHSCDNRACINPNHLFLGTNQDNVDDKVRKGRQWCPKGVLAPWAKLTAEQVLEIRETWRNRKRVRGTVSSLAERFGVSCSTISRITHERGWGHL